MNNRQRIKFNRPGINDHYHRQRLLDRIKTSLQQKKWCWIYGPPGAGKTVLAATLTANIDDSRVIWYRIESADRDIQTFRQNLYIATGAKSPPSEPFVPGSTDLLETLFEVTSKLPPAALWVWDGCEQLPPDSPQLDSLAKFLEEHPDNPQMIFVSRQSPCGRFRHPKVLHLLEVYDWQDLRLDREETVAIIKLYGQDRKLVEGATSLHARSDGWAAALMLLLQGAGEKDIGHRDSALFGYLADEMLQHLQPHTRHMLMQLATLPCIPAETAREMLADAQADLKLTQFSAVWHLLEVSQGEPPVFRFHPLLQEFLLAQLGGTFSESEIRDIYLRGAVGLERVGLREEACRLFHRAGAGEDLQRLVMALAKELADAGRYRTLHGLLETIPQPVAEKDVWHGYWLGLCLRFEEPARGWPLLEDAYEKFRTRGEVSGQYAAWLAVVEAMLVVFEDLGPLKRWLAEYEALRQRHPRCPDMGMRLKCLALAGSAMSLVAPRHPKLAKLIRLVEMGVRLIPFKTPRQAAFAYLTLHYVNTGQISRMHGMAKHLLPGLDDPSLPGPLRLSSHSVIGLCEILTGGPAPERILTPAVDFSNRTGGGLFRTYPRAFLVYYELICGRLAEARKHLQEYERVMPPHNRMLQAAQYFMSAWLAIADGETGKGLELSDLSKTMGQQLSFDLGVALNAGLRAQAFAGLARFDAAQSELDELAQLAELSGNQPLLVMHGFCAAWQAHCQQEFGECRRLLATTLDSAQREGIFAFPSFLRPVMAELARVAASEGLAESYIRRLVTRWQLSPPELSQLETAWPWPVRIRCLGRFELVVGEQRLDFGQAAHRRPLELLAALIALGGRDVPKSQLGELLWPDTEADKAHHALDNLIYRLRKLLGNDSLMLSASLISLNATLCWIDTWALEALAEDRATGSGPHHTAHLVQNLYGGSFLIGEESYWALPARERLRALFILLVTQMTDRLIEERERVAAVELLEWAIGREPLSESLYLLLMQCNADDGRPVDASRVYQRCRQAMALHLGVEPGEAIRAYARSLDL